MAGTGPFETPEQVARSGFASTATRKARVWGLDMARVIPADAANCKPERGFQEGGRRAYRSVTVSPGMALMAWRAAGGRLYLPGKSSSAS